MKKFKPQYRITTSIMEDLVRIGTTKEKITHLPITATVLDSLRESARLDTTHYSTMIEGNRLTLAQVEEAVHHKGHFPGREREMHEVLGQYAALAPKYFK